VIKKNTTLDPAPLSYPAPDLVAAAPIKSPLLHSVPVLPASLVRIQTKNEKIVTDLLQKFTVKKLTELFQNENSGELLFKTRLENGGCLFYELMISDNHAALAKPKFEKKLLKLLTTLDYANLSSEEDVPTLFFLTALPIFYPLLNKLTNNTAFINQLNGKHFFRRKSCAKTHKETHLDNTSMLYWLTLPQAVDLLFSFFKKNETILSQIPSEAWCYQASNTKRSPLNNLLLSVIGTRHSDNETHKKTGRTILAQLIENKPQLFSEIITSLMALFDDDLLPDFTYPNLNPVIHSYLDLDNLLSRHLTLEILTQPSTVGFSALFWLTNPA
jgi:hypothetical protein